MKKNRIEESQVKTVGVFLARMQPVHKAHLFMVTKACEECDEVCVILGSENKKDTLRNPFTIEKRREMLLESLPEEYRSKISVYEIPDWSMETKTEDDKVWGRYFYYNVVSRIGQKHFKLYYSDGIDNLNSWFDSEVKPYIEQFCPKVVMDNFDYLRNYYLGVVDKPKEDWEME